MKRINLLLTFIFAMLAVHLSVYAADAEITGYEQDIEKNCIRLRINTPAECEYLAVIASRIPIAKDTPRVDIALNTVAVVQMKPESSVSSVELYYDERNITSKEIYIYVNTGGTQNEELVIPFSTRNETIIRNFKEAESWNVYAGLIKKYNAAFNMFALSTESAVKLSSLNGVSEADVYKTMYMSRNGFNSTSDIEQAYSSAIDSVYKSAQSTAGGGSGGGGGGRNSSPNPTVPNIAPEKSAPANTSAQNGISAGETEVFTDMAGYEWAGEAVRELKKRNIINGISENEYNPGGTVTREDFVKILVSAAGYELSGGHSGFNDVAGGAYYEQYVNTAYNKGIVTGINNTEFGTGMPITRQDIAVILYRAFFKEENEQDAPDFTDYDKISPYARNAVSCLTAGGIINGMDDGSFRPQEYATRAQAAQLIYRIILNSGL